MRARYGWCPADVVGGVGVIGLTQGYVALVDPQLVFQVQTRAWSYSHGYAQSKTPGVGKLYLHHFILALAGMERGKLHADHVNLDTLDNRIANLRLATRSQNQMNRGLQSNNTSGFRGAYFDRKTGNWFAAIKTAGKFNYIGKFPTAEAAARAYDDAVLKINPDFARLNFPRAT